jgi:hypothetical protein
MLTKRPWLLIVMAFLLLIGAWTTLILVATRNPPEEVPLESDRE